MAEARLGARSAQGPTGAYAGDTPTTNEALFRRSLVRVVLMMAALRGVLAVVTELRQLVIEGLDGGFLLAKDFLYQLVAMGFERLLLCEEFIDRIVGHVEYDAIAGATGGGHERRREAEPALFPFFAGRYHRNNNLRGYDQSLFLSVFSLLF